MIIIQTFLTGFCSVMALALFALLTGRTTEQFTWDRLLQGLKQFFLVAIWVALAEELVFRVIPWLLFGINEVVIVLSSLMFATVHFLYGMYKKETDAKEIAMLYTGLSILGFCLYYMQAFAPYLNIIYHASIVTGVSVTALIFTKELDKDKWFWDEGHKIIRTPLAWMIMIIGTAFILGV